MPALFPIIAIIAVFIFISAHASTHPPRRRYSDNYRSGGGSRSGGSGDYGRSSGGSSRGGSGGGSRGGYDRGGDSRGGSKQYDRGRY